MVPHGARSRSSESDNLTDKTYKQLRADLIACRLAPGSRLNVASLCKRLSVSPGAVRESLSRLTSENLVVVERNRGFRAAPISQEDIKQLSAAITPIDTACLSSAMTLGGIEWESNLVAAAHSATRLRDKVGQSTEDDDAYVIAVDRFFEALLAACDNRWLLRIRKQLFIQVERYRSLTLPLAHDRRELMLYQEPFLGYVLGRDIEKAVKMIAAVHDMALHMILERWASQPHSVPGQIQRKRGARSNTKKAVKRSAKRRRTAA